MSRYVQLFLFILVIYACSPKIVEKEKSERETVLTYPTAYVIKENVNVRAENNTHSNIIKKLKDGDKIYIIQNKNGWYEIRDDENNLGWLRSDLVGPRELSRTILASVFVDSLLPNFQSQMYFDNEALYKIVYLILPNSYYTSTSKAEEYATEIGKLYQKKVYPGKLELRIMTKDTDDLYARVTLSAIENPDTPVPIIEAGQLISLSESNKQVTIGVAVDDGVSNSKLLNLARKISAHYDFPYTKAEIYITLNTPEGINFLKDFSRNPMDKNICKLYYVEDKNGEYFKYNFCD